MILHTYYLHYTEQNKGQREILIEREKKRRQTKSVNFKRQVGAKPGFCLHSLAEIDEFLGRDFADCFSDPDQEYSSTDLSRIQGATLENLTISSRFLMSTHLRTCLKLFFLSLILIRIHT